MSDLIFNHSEHHHLLQTATQCLSTDGRILVGFSHHRPHKINEDMNFFKLALGYGLVVEWLFDEKVEEMFKEDQGDLEVRRTVRVFEMRVGQEGREYQ